MFCGSVSLLHSLRLHCGDEFSVAQITFQFKFYRTMSITAKELISFGDLVCIREQDRKLTNQLGKKAVERSIFAEVGKNSYVVYPEKRERKRKGERESKRWRERRREKELTQYIHDGRSLQKMSRLRVFGLLWLGSRGPSCFLNISSSSVIHSSVSNSVRQPHFSILGAINTLNECDKVESIKIRELLVYSSTEEWCGVLMSITSRKF